MRIRLGQRSTGAAHWIRNLWDEGPVGVDDLGNNHLERPFHVRAGLDGDLDMVEQVQGFEETSGPGGRDTPLLHEVGLGAVEQDGQVPVVSVTDLGPLFQRIESGGSCRIVEEDCSLCPEPVARQHEPEVILPPKVPELERHGAPLVGHLLHVRLLISIGGGKRPYIFKK